VNASKITLEGNTIEVNGELTNGTAESWSQESGYGIGYQLFDDPTGTLVIDGQRKPLNLAPAKTAAFTLTIPVPPEPGEYSIRVSAMRENHAWFYDEGKPFLLIEARVTDNGTPALTGWSVSSKNALARKRMARSFLRAFTLPLKAVWKNRSLVRTLVRRDILGRYSGSFGGAFWAVLNPLLLMLTYFFVFGMILKSKFPGDPTQSGFALYYLAGFLPWLAFSEAIGRAPFTMVEHRGFIKKLVFPVEILPVNLVVAGLVTEFFGVILFAIALLILRGHVPATALYLPVLLIPQILFTAGICWFLAALGVFVRDLAQINGFLVTIWFFITPICYAETPLFHEGAGRILTKNPIYILVRAYRAIFLESRAPDWTPLAWLTVFSAIVFLLGHAWFFKLRKSFTDII
jgi:lipopolysaccharide transport system permease protein